MRLSLDSFLHIPKKGNWISRIPDTIGIYVFANGNKPLYIGKSVHLRSRVRSHIKAAKLSLKERAFRSNGSSSSA